MEQEQNKRLIRVLIITLSLVVAFVAGFFSQCLFASKQVNLASEIVGIMNQVGFVYDESTGEKRPITEEEIAEALVNGLFDKHSAYYTEEEYEKVQQEDKGNKVGVGIGFFDKDNVIDKIDFNSPADVSGIEVGDKIIGCVCGGQSVTITDKNTFADFVLPLQTGSEISIIVERNAQQKTFTLTKAEYISALVEYKDNQTTFLFRTENGELVSKIEQGGIDVDDSTAYIQFTNFDYGASEQMEQALDYMKERGKTKLILDLRNNGGGFMSELGKVASLLIYNQGESKSLVSHAKTAKSEKNYYTSSNKFNTDITKIVVLANQNTASASEALIGAMLYYGDRFSKDNLIIEKNPLGTCKTYGKGIMQTTFGLVNGGALKITTGKIFWPDKTTCVQDKGIYTTEQNSVEVNGAMARAKEILA